MTPLHQRLNLFAAALWWGSITVLGFGVVPALFRLLPSTALAGHTAAQLFAMQTWVALACGVCLLLLNKGRAALRYQGEQAVPADRHAQWLIACAALGLLVAIVNQFGVAPRIIARENLRLWHGVGTGLYLIEWLAVTALMWRMIPSRPREEKQ